jgi:hypothetical protein
LRAALIVLVMSAHPIFANAIVWGVVSREAA